MVIASVDAMLAYAALATPTPIAEHLSWDGWQPIETAPYAVCVLAARFDTACGEWVYGVVLSPPSRPFTHWMPLPAPPGAARSPPAGMMREEQSSGDGQAPFHVSRSSDGEREWFSARDAAAGVTIPGKDRSDAYNLVQSLNRAVACHVRQALAHAAATKDEVLSDVGGGK
jgi:hypothetical protein